MSDSKILDYEYFFENDDTQTNIEMNEQTAEKLNLGSEEKVKVKGKDPLPLIKGTHSLVPDMKFGWRPEVSVSTPPIPLYFDFLQHPYEEIRHNDDIVYNGFRPLTSFKLHEEYSNKTNCYSFTFPKHHKIGSYKYEGAFERLLKFCENEDDREFVGMNPVFINTPFVFNSKFESGNLDLVVKLFDKEEYYNCFLRPDSNSNGNIHWFYFSVSNSMKGDKLTLNIANLTKYTSLFEQGFKPSVFSFQKFQNKGIGWHRISRDVSYKRVLRKGRIFFNLEFEYEFDYDEDVVWFATSIPYTYSCLMKYIKSIEEKVVRPLQTSDDPLNPLINSKSEKKRSICEIKSIGKSLGGLNIPMIEITDYNCSKDELERRKIVLVCTRVHPGETNSSWITHGLIDALLGNSHVAKGLRSRIIFQIVPMMNPDGVVLGNHRCSLIGKDINRTFERPNSKLEPEAHCLRKHLKKIQKEAFQAGRIDKIQAFIDVHSHSNRKSIFMYGPHYPLHSSNYMKIRVIPKLMSERTVMFRFYSCKFRTEQYKENCARLSLWRNFKIQTSLTIESSFHGYLNSDRETKIFTESNLQYFGQAFTHSLFEYLLILEENKRQKLALAKKLSKKRKFQK